jgi:hypothetical protein
MHSNSRALIPWLQSSRGQKGNSGKTFEEIIENLQIRQKIYICKFSAYLALGSIPSTAK